MGRYSREVKFSSFLAFIFFIRFFGNAIGCWLGSHGERLMVVVCGGGACCPLRPILPSIVLPPLPPLLSSGASPTVPETGRTRHWPREGPHLPCRRSRSTLRRTWCRCSRAVTTIIGSSSSMSPPAKAAPSHKWLIATFKPSPRFLEVQVPPL